MYSLTEGCQGTSGLFLLWPPTGTQKMRSKIKWEEGEKQKLTVEFPTGAGLTSLRFHRFSSFMYCPEPHLALGRWQAEAEPKDTGVSLETRGRE